MTKTYELIYTDTNVLAVDREAEIKEGIAICSEKKIGYIIEIKHKVGLVRFKEGYTDVLKSCFNIIASKLPFSNLPLIPQSVFEKQEEDVEKLADEYTKDQYDEDYDNLAYQPDIRDCKRNFIDGYQAAKSKYGFTKEDIMKVIEMARESEMVEEIAGFERYKYHFLDILSSLQQSRPKALECEMIEDERQVRYSDGSWSRELEPFLRPKTNEKNELIVINVIY